MKDLTNAKWELTNNDKIAIHWFEENGFDVTLLKQYISKTIYLVQKNGIEDRFELPNGFNYDTKSYMEQYRKQFDILIRLRERNQ